jgi:putative transcriptional regulator
MPFIYRRNEMAVSYKPLLHMMIEKDVSNAELMRRAHISANIITKIKNGQYIALEKVESICNAMNCTPNEMMEFTKDSDEEDRTNKAEVSK